MSIKQIILSMLAVVGLAIGIQSLKYIPTEDSVDEVLQKVEILELDGFERIATAADSLVPKSPYRVHVIDFITERKYTIGGGALPGHNVSDWYQTRLLFGARGKFNWVDSLPARRDDVIKVISPVRYVGSYFPVTPNDE